MLCAWLDGILTLLNPACYDSFATILLPVWLLSGILIPKELFCMAHWRMASEGSMAGLGDFGGTCRRVGRMVKSGRGIEGDEARLTQSPVGAADHGICQCETADGEKGIK